MSSINIDGVMEELTRLLSVTENNKNGILSFEAKIDSINILANTFRHYDYSLDSKTNDIWGVSGDKRVLQKHYFAFKTTGADIVNEKCSYIKNCLENIREDFNKLIDITNNASNSMELAKDLLAQVLIALGEEPSRVEGSIDYICHYKKEDNVFKKIQFKTNKDRLSVGGLTDDEYNDYSSQFEFFLNKHRGSQREKTVAAAIFLSTIFPRLPYFLGGGEALSAEEFTGISRNWGPATNIGTLDCAGFVSWCLINGGYDLVGNSPNGTAYNNVTCLSDIAFNAAVDTGEPFVERLDITDPRIINTINVGDLAEWVDEPGDHVGIIVDIDRGENTVTVAHCSESGDGMNLTTISTENGLVVDDQVGDTTPRVGNIYFKYIIPWTYDDEKNG